MKLKKLLAAVTAAALAVTTMAVTSFTASAADVKNPVSVTLYDKSNAVQGLETGSGVNYSLKFPSATAENISDYAFIITAADGSTGGSYTVYTNNEKGEPTWDWDSKYANGSVANTGDTVISFNSLTDAQKPGLVANGCTLQISDAIITKVIWMNGTDNEVIYQFNSDAVISQAIFNAEALAAFADATGFSAEVTGEGGSYYFQETNTWKSIGGDETANYEHESWENYKAAATAGKEIKIALDNYTTLTKVVVTFTYDPIPGEGGDGEGGDEPTPPAADTSEWQIAVNGFTSSWGGWKAATATVGELTYTCTIKDVMDANKMTSIDELGGIIVQAWNVPLGDKVSYAIRIEAADGTVKANDTGTWTVVVNGGEGDDKDKPNYSLKQYAIAACGGNLEFAPTDVVKIAVAAGTTIPTIPAAPDDGGDDNTDGVYALLWEGKKDMPTDWSGSVEIEIPAELLAKIKVGDKIVSTITNAADGAQFALKQKDESWSALPGFADATGGNGYCDITGTTYTHIVTAADLEALKLPLIVSGHDYTLTKVELNPDNKSKPDDKPGHTHTAVGDWKSDATNHWHVCECGEEIDKAAHAFGSGVITKPATETTTGIITYTCECGYTKTETIPATGGSSSVYPPVYPIGAPVIPVGTSGSNAPTVNGNSGWEAVSAEIVTSSDGDKIVVTMNSATKVPSTILGDIEGRDIDVVFNMGRGITWTINGLSVTNRKTIDLDISKNTRHIPDEVVDKAEGSHKKQFSLDHKGTFGCTAALTYEVGTKYNGLYANLFYYNPKTEQLEFADCSLVSGGKAKFMFTHASDYLITISDEPLGEFEDVSSAAGIASDNGVIGNGAAIGSVLAVIVLGFGIVVYRKRRHN